MRKEELAKQGSIVFFGDCHAIVVRERFAGDNYPGRLPNERINPIIEIWTEDDEWWHKSTSFDAACLPELIMKLISAEDLVTIEWPKIGKLREVIKR